MLHLWVVLVLTMVQFRSHHLRHQWSQINTFVFLNHIRHHTYFKSSYVHIQVFHILHHHTMKLLLAFKSFLLRRLIVEIGSENWFAAGCPIRQHKLVHCWQPIRQWKLVADSSVSTTNHNFIIANSTSTTIRCRQLHFGSESQVRCRNRQRKLRR